MVIQKVIADIRFEIPLEVLEVAFLGDTGRERLRPGSLDWEIRNKVIDAKVRPDCDLMGAQEMNIPLARAEIIYDKSGLYRNVVRIPKALTQGRTITEALYFNYIYWNGAVGQFGGAVANSYGSTSCGSSPLMANAGRILGSSGDDSLTGTAAVRLIGENTVVINDYMGSLTQGSLVCRVSHDSEMNSIPPLAIPQFSQLCIYATKAWIYKTLMVKLNGGYLSGGTELGQIQNFIENYSDAGELYKEYFREEIQAALFTTDNTRNSWYLRNLIGGGA